MNSMIRTSILLLPLALILAGCSNATVLPRTEEKVESPWQTFEEAKRAYDHIKPELTTVAELRRLGFDPYKTSNIRILTYLDVLSVFMPNDAIDLRDLDPALRDCLAAKDKCYAYEATPSHIVDQRSGNVLLDVMDFRKETVQSGWTFKALIVLHDDRVVYKLWGGTPQVSKVTTDSSPLGPLQEVSLSRFL